MCLLVQIENRRTNNNGVYTQLASTDSMRSPHKLQCEFWASLECLDKPNERQSDVQMYKMNFQIY